jgi:hypothetical protein
MPEPTNAVILERLNNLIDINAKEHKDVCDHLIQLNGQVARHTKWMAKNGEDVPENTKARRNLKLYWLTGVLAAGGVGGAASGELWPWVSTLLSSLT